MTYRVTATLKNPGCYHSGWETTLSAKTKAEAIKWARQDAKKEMIFDRHDGPVSWKAEEVGA
jgi:hypothetical protein